MSIIQTNIGEIIRVKRKEKELTQESLAKLTKLHVKTIEIAENNWSWPRNNTLRQLNKVLDIPEITQYLKLKKVWKYYEHLADYLVYLRDEAEFTVQELSLQSGIPYVEIHAFENCARKNYFPVLFKLCKFYKISHGEFEKRALAHYKKTHPEQIKKTFILV